ncbi:hypothetical protein NKH69_33745 [Mesorhizobium sp. M0976]|uniref:hypothetical protein n=1 Tax=Mesorhizobium sp. M0976 TaxID=2957038 RepID=UPI003334BE72
MTVVVDRLKGKTQQGHLFVAVLGASSLAFAEEALEREASGLAGCHVNAIEAFVAWETAVVR